MDMSTLLLHRREIKGEDLSHYYRMFPPFKPLEYSEEQELVLQAQSGNRQAEEKLILQWGRLAISTALRAAKPYVEGIDVEDLIGWGFLGLCIGIRAYNPLRGTRLSTCLYLWIKAHIQQGIRSHRFIHLPSDSLRVYYSLLYIMAQQPIDVSKDEEWERILPEVKSIVSPRKPLTAQGLKEIYNKAISSQTFHYEMQPNSENYSNTYALAVARGNDVISAPQSRLDVENINALREEVEELSQREREILTNLYGLGNSERLTLAEVGKKFCISRQRVAQIENRVLALLRFRLLKKVSM